MTDEKWLLCYITGAIVIPTATLIFPWLFVPYGIIVTLIFVSLVIYTMLKKD